MLRAADTSPVRAKAILRLARPEPVLTLVQLELALWIADYYVAPLAESVKLFLDPGLLQKTQGEGGVRAKREAQIEWIGGATTLETCLGRLGRTDEGFERAGLALGQHDACGQAG